MSHRSLFVLYFIASLVFCVLLCRIAFFSLLASFSSTSSNSASFSFFGESHSLHPSLFWGVSFSTSFSFSSSWEKTLALHLSLSNLHSIPSFSSLSLHLSLFSSRHSMHRRLNRVLSLRSLFVSCMYTVRSYLPVRHLCFTILVPDSLLESAGH